MDMPGWRASLHLLAVCAGIMTAVGNVRVIAKHGQTFQLACGSDFQGTVSGIQWLVEINQRYENVINVNRLGGVGNKYTVNKDASVSVANPVWLGCRWHRCYRQHQRIPPDIEVCIVKDVQTNEDIASKVGEPTLIPCQANQKNSIIPAATWLFALDGRPFYRIETNRDEHPYAQNSDGSLLLTNVESADAGFYLCVVGYFNLRDTTALRGYETKLDVIEGPPGVILTAGYVAVALLSVATLVGAAVYCARRRSNRTTSKGQRSKSDDGDRTCDRATVPPMRDETAGPAPPGPDIVYASVTFTDGSVSYSVPPASSASAQSLKGQRSNSDDEGNTCDGVTMPPISDQIIYASVMFTGGERHQ